MKRFMPMLGGLAVVLAVAGIAFAQRNPRATAMVMLRAKTVTIEYGRPSLHGRSVEEMLAQLQPGDIWRLGADKSTTFTTTGDLKIGDVTIPKGEYSLWARKETDNSWKLVFNKQHGQWGTDHDAAQDLAAVPLKETKVADSAEQVTIELSKAGTGGQISISWGKLNLTTTFL